MVRFLAYALGTIGLVDIVGWILVMGADFDPGGVLALWIYLSAFALPLLAALAAVWLVFDTVRRFIRCRMTRTA